MQDFVHGPARIGNHLDSRSHEQRLEGSGDGAAYDDLPVELDNPPGAGEELRVLETNFAAVRFVRILDFHDEEASSYVEDGGDSPFVDGCGDSHSRSGVSKGRATTRRYAHVPCFAGDWGRPKEAERSA